MCKLCETWGFNGWECEETRPGQVRFQCPRCRRLYGYLTRREFETLYPDRKLIKGRKREDGTSENRESAGF